MRSKDDPLVTTIREAAQRGLTAAATKHYPKGSSKGGQFMAGGGGGGTGAGARLTDKEFGNVKVRLVQAMYDSGNGDSVIDKKHLSSVLEKQGITPATDPSTLKGKTVYYLPPGSRKSGANLPADAALLFSQSGDRR